MAGVCAGSTEVRRLAWRASPAEAIARWPVGEPLAALIGADARGVGGRWSILARPGPSATSWPAVREALSPSPRAGRVATPNDPPLRSGWIGWLGYELGGVIEPAAGTFPAAVPVARLYRCEGALAHDSATGAWFSVGDPAAIPPIELAGPARSPDNHAVGPLLADGGDARARATHEAMVHRALEHIRAGDVFQVNLTRRLRAEFAGSPRALFLHLLNATAPAYGALVEGPAAGEAVVSLSPELFLRVDAGTGRVVTRPIKGTAPGSAPPDRLAASAKDAAELAMIVDLMRNDLGRVCEYGSVRVTDARSIERHGSRDRRAGVWHGVATVEGRIRAGATVADLVEASFPAGSITGAPKIRAMQIIAELERSPRGPHYGAVGFVGDDGAAVMSVAIRTAVVRGGALEYAVGGGIVAGSEPSAEWAETEAKAAGLRRALARAAPTGRPG
ncbi:MAG: anthranilate synthase component I family protein [Planctomycetota bacterium]|nr:MAG: anthranilate synthase component I family protein [Planctomycetota bacterium]